MMMLAQSDTLIGMYKVEAVAQGRTEGFYLRYLLS